MDSFAYTSHPGRVVFGRNTLASLAGEIDRLGTRALLCCTPGREAEVEALARNLGDRVAGICAIAKLYVPVEIVAEAQAVARASGADCLVSYGGGTAIGLAKGIALELDLPIVSVVTTYSGSETTDRQGMLEGGAKKMHASPRMLPSTVIYDPDLLGALPLEVLIPSGINAVAHAVEAFYGEGANPVSSIIAEEGIRAMAEALPRIASAPSDIDALGDGLYGAWLCSLPINATGVALHHKAAHAVGGGWNLPHADTHTILLPHSVAYNRPAAPEAMQRVSRALATEADAAVALFDLLERIGAPTALRDLGMPEGDIGRAADLIMAAPYYNPRPMEAGALREMLSNAWRGQRPEAG